jgi:hypothetical protein
MKFSRTYNDGFDDSTFDVDVTEVLVGTPDTAAELVDEAITSSLALLRKNLGMNVAFVAAPPPGSGSGAGAGAKGTTVVLSGNLRSPEERRRSGDNVPELLGKAHAALSAGEGEDPAAPGSPARIPVMRTDGRMHGMLVCFGAGRGKAPSVQDVRNLRFAASMIADKLNQKPAAEPAPEAAAPAPAGPTTLDWELQPVKRVPAGWRAARE